MKWKLVVALVLCGFIGMAAAKSWDTNRSFDQTFASTTTFTLRDTVGSTPDTTLTSVPAPDQNQYLEIAALDTMTSIEIGPWRTVVLMLRISPGADSADDSVDTRVYCDASWDGTNWAVLDSVDLTDTLPHTKEVDSASTFNGSWIRLRVDPITGMRQTLMGERPYIRARVIAK